MLAHAVVLLVFDKRRDPFVHGATALYGLQMLDVESGGVSDCLTERCQQVVTANGHNVQARIDVGGSCSKVLHCTAIQRRAGPRSRGERK
jgi:hypothetical protein